MTRISRIGIALVSAALALGGSSIALAQMSGSVEAAMNGGKVGEQADGYLGFVAAPDSALKAEVDAINIKRREAYTNLAQSKNVPIEAVAASVGCKTLSSLKPGRAYSVAKGAWATKGAAAVQLPPQCGG